MVAAQASGSNDRKPRLLRATIILAAVLLQGATGGARAADDDAPGEYQVKAAFLYNFARYVTWPDSVLRRTSSPFVFGVLGDDPFGFRLDEALEGKTVGERPAVVHRYARIDEAAGADVLFVSSSERRNLPQILAALGNAPVLVVGEGEDFVRHGGMIGLHAEGRKIRFDINLRAVERAGIKPSSQLLKLARTVAGSTGAR